MKIGAMCVKSEHWLKYWSLALKVSMVKSGAHSLKVSNGQKWSPCVKSKHELKIRSHIHELKIGFFCICKK